MLLLGAALIAATGERTRLDRGRHERDWRVIFPPPVGGTTGVAPR
jgi:hypothetical protein